MFGRETVSLSLLYFKLFAFNLNPFLIAFVDMTLNNIVGLSIIVYNFEIKVEIE